MFGRVYVTLWEALLCAIIQSLPEILSEGVYLVKHESQIRSIVE